MGVSDLTGRKALVTGGVRGLGAGMAEALALAGAAVVIGDIREDLGKATVDTLRSSGATAGFVGVRGVLACAAAAAPGGVRLRLPGVRPPRAAGRAAQLRPGHGAERDRPALTRPPAALAAAP